MRKKKPKSRFCLTLGFTFVVVLIVVAQITIALHVSHSQVSFEQLVDGPSRIPSSPKGRNLRKEEIHVLYGLSGNETAFLSEFEISLKSVLLNSPIDYNMTIHFMTDDAAYRELPAILNRTKLETWTTRNQISIQIYNTQSKIESWSRHIEKKTGYSIDDIAGRHTIGMFFRLFVQNVVDANVNHILYLDTDVVVMARLDDLWNHVHRNPKSFFQWGKKECSGFIVLNVPRIDELWELASTLNFKKYSRKLSQMPGDQLVFRSLNRSHPNIVSILPPEWDVPLAHDLWKGPLMKYRPDGVGHLHLNGVSQSNKSVFESDGVLTSARRSNDWGLANYFARIPWPWAKFVSESAGKNHKLIIRQTIL